MLEKLDGFLNENKFKIILEDNSLYISNYKRIISLENEYVSLITPTKKIQISGSNLSLKKILDKELLIKGKITKIEVLDE